MMVMYCKCKVFVHLHNLKFQGVSYAAASVPTYSTSVSRFLSFSPEIPEVHNQIRPADSDPAGIYLIIIIIITIIII